MADQPDPADERRMWAFMFCSGGVLALIGFFVPWWVTKASGQTFWYGPAIALVRGVGPAVQFGGSACSETMLLIAFLLSEVVMCVTGAAAFKPQRSSCGGLKSLCRRDSSSPSPAWARSAWSAPN